MKKIKNYTFKNAGLSTNVSVFALAVIVYTSVGIPLHAEEPLHLPAVLLTVTETAEVSAARAGILVKIFVREGQLVRQSQKVAELDNAKALVNVEEGQLKLRMAQQVAEDDIDIRYAKKTFEQAASELRRSVAVNNGLPGTISERELELLQLAVERSELEIERAEKEHHLSKMKWEQHQVAVRMAELELAEHTFLAPIGGMVVRVSKRPGEWIEPGDSLVKIVRIDRVRAEGFLPAEQAKLTLMGCPAEVAVEVSKSSTIRLQGKITFVSPEVNPVSGMVRIWSEFDCGDSPLRPGLRGTVQIQNRDHGKQ